MIDNNLDTGFYPQTFSLLDPCSLTGFAEG
jgi:hypothetical protein